MPEGEELADGWYILAHTFNNNCKAIYHKLEDISVTYNQEEQVKTVATEEQFEVLGKMQGGAVYVTLTKEEKARAQDQQQKEGLRAREEKPLLKLSVKGRRGHMRSKSHDRGAELQARANEKDIRTSEPLIKRQPLSFKLMKQNSDKEKIDIQVSEFTDQVVNSHTKSESDVPPTPVSHDKDPSPDSSASEKSTTQMNNSDATASTTKVTKNLFICYRRDVDAVPIRDVGFLYAGRGEQLFDSARWTPIDSTILGSPPKNGNTTTKLEKANSATSSGDALHFPSLDLANIVKNPTNEADRSMPLLCVRKDSNSFSSRKVVTGLALIEENEVGGEKTCHSPAGLC